MKLRIVEETGRSGSVFFIQQRGLCLPFFWDYVTSDVLPNGEYTVQPKGAVLKFYELDDARAYCRIMIAGDVKTRKRYHAP